MRIRLDVTEAQDWDALEHNHPAVTYLLRMPLRLRLKEGWSELQRAIVDTGSPYSVIPKILEPALHVKPLYRSRLGGLVPREFIYGTMASVECKAIDTDGETMSPSFHVRALLTDRPDMPLILGIHGFLDQYDLTSKIARREAWIDIP